MLPWERLGVYLLCKSYHQINNQSRPIVAWTTQPFILLISENENRVKPGKQIAVCSFETTKLLFWRNNSIWRTNTLFERPPVSHLIKPGDITKEFQEKTILFQGTFYGLKITNWSGHPQWRLRPSTVTGGMTAR